MEINYSGKTFGDYFAVLRRRRMLVLISFMVVFISGVYFAYSLPPTYESTATILIEQQNISEQFVQTTVTSYADEQIQLVRQRVMATPTLTGIVEKYDLYPEIRATEGIEMAVAELRRDTLLEPQSAEVVNPRSGREMYATIAFELSFAYSDPSVTQAVTRELADLYLSENAESRTVQVQETIDFLQEDVDRAERDVDKASATLADFKESNGGNLPELTNFNLQSKERTEQQLDQLDREIRDSRTRQFTLETELTKNNGLTGFDENGDPLVGAAQSLADLQNERLRLLSIYTPEHPSVVQVERGIELLRRGNSGSSRPQVSEIRARLEAEKAKLASARQIYSAEHPDVVSLARSVATLEQELELALTSTTVSRDLASLAALDPVSQQLSQQIEAERTYLQTLLSRRAQLESKLEDLQAIIAAMPRIEREFEALSQQNELATDRYWAAMERLDEARRGQMLESAGNAERYTLLEPPLLPRTPAQPNRTALVLLATVLALGLGIGLATVIDAIDDSVKGSADLVQLTGAPPIAVIPFIETPFDRRRRISANVGATLLVVLGLGGAAVITQVMG